MAILINLLEEPGSRKPREDSTIDKILGIPLMRNIESKENEGSGDIFKDVLFAIRPLSFIGMLKEYKRKGTDSPEIYLTAFMMEALKVMSYGMVLGGIYKELIK